MQRERVRFFLLSIAFFGFFESLSGLLLFFSGIGKRFPVREDEVGTKPHLVMTNYALQALSNMSCSRASFFPQFIIIIGQTRVLAPFRSTPETADILRSTLFAESRRNPQRFAPERIDEVIKRNVADRLPLTPVSTRGTESEVDATIWQVWMCGALEALALASWVG